MRFPELARALERAARQLGAGNDFEVQLERPREAGHGDVASNAAMVLAGRLRRRPRELAQDIIEALDLASLHIERAEIAGPGFINFRLSVDYLLERVRLIAAAGDDYGRSDLGAGRPVNVEFVSANPTGPLHVGHGRGAAVGDTIARLLEFTGHRIQREFYVNDAGAQIDKLLESIHARYRQLQGEESVIPEGGYHGDYVIELAKALADGHGERLSGTWGAEERQLARQYALASVIDEQRAD
ncbi:MAG: arginine--tRNA ligase, partial [Gemmatimonadota bacterium]